MTRLAAGTCFLGLLVGLLSGCGSTTHYVDKLQGTVDGVASVLHQYNDEHPNDLAGTAKACNDALDRLNSEKPVAKPVPKQYRNFVNVLRRVISLARAGFSDCAKGSGSGSYPRAAKGYTELQEANGWIKRLKAMRPKS